MDARVFGLQPRGVHHEIAAHGSWSRGKLPGHPDEFAAAAVRSVADGVAGHGGRGCHVVREHGLIAAQDHGGHGHRGGGAD